MSISPSLSPRQCPDRYAFRAGRNLPDKEFRYLRTVIVTAAVHRGFGRRLPCHQSPGPGHCDPLCEEAPLLPKLRGYFAEFLRESCLAPLGILYLPTCVGFGYRYPFVEGRSSFSWEYGMDYFSAVAPGPDSPSEDEPCGGTLRLAFATAPVVSLNQATAYESPAHSSTGTRSESPAGLLPLLGSLRFHVLFHSPMGVLFTLPSRYYFTIGHPGVFSLARWSLLIHTGFHVPHATRVRA
ncbi:hypothetical protein VNO77_50669 [Canavalia gladiata]|uniref:Uncharacterized protein n=1 Tax=Canavalia gladiata TaxID=3824 RepID=A0AAN9JF61_CANGL